MLGERIKKLRLGKNLSQEKLAELVGVSRQTISNWELGGSFPDSEELVKLSKELNISIDDLVNNKINNIERIVKKDLKITKIILFTVYVIILFSLIIFIIYILNKKDFTSYFDSDFSCYNSEQKVNISLEEDEDKYYIFVSEYDEKYYAGDTLEEVFKNLDIAKKILIKEGYICK